MIEELIPENEKGAEPAPTKGIFAHAYCPSGWVFELADLKYFFAGLTAAGALALDENQKSRLNKEGMLHLQSFEPAFNYESLYDVITQCYDAKPVEYFVTKLDAESKEALIRSVINLSKVYVKTDFTRELIESDRLTSAERTELNSLKNVRVLYAFFEIESMDAFKKAMSRLEYGGSSYLLY